MEAKIWTIIRSFNNIQVTLHGQQTVAATARNKKRIQPKISSNSCLFLHAPWTEWLYVGTRAEWCLGCSRCLINDRMMTIRRERTYRSNLRCHMCKTWTRASASIYYLYSACFQKVYKKTPHLSHWGQIKNYAVGRNKTDLLKEMLHC